MLMSYEERLSALGQRARELRLLRELQQRDLARRAGVGLATVQRFERTGRASLENVLRIALALGVDAPFDGLFAAPEFRSIDEVLARPVALQRQRIRRRS
jgi:transcriptional regulator with XRE-family HTH domain